MQKLRVGILGATGAAGMEFIRVLYDHPWFEIAEFYAGKSAGKTLEEAVSLGAGEFLGLSGTEIRHVSNVSQHLDLICSALPSDVARVVEAECAAHTPVISTASAYRYEKDVPILITEINPEHHQLLEAQRNRGWKGWIAPGPNCTTVGLAMSLYPLHKEIGIRHVGMASYQAISGGGKELVDEWENQRTIELPGPLQGAAIMEEPHLTLDGNIIGNIKGEDAKVRTETKKILGIYDGSHVIPARIGVSPKCFRVPVLDGHTEAVYVETASPCTVEDVIEIYNLFNQCAYNLFGSLPSSPRNFITLMERAPQPRIDVNLDGGMSAILGKIEQMDGKPGISYVVLSHNLQRGAAKGIVHVAEYLYSIGFLRNK